MKDEVWLCNKDDAGSGCEKSNVVRPSEAFPQKESRKQDSEYRCRSKKESCFPYGECPGKGARCKWN